MVGSRAALGIAIGLGLCPLAVFGGDQGRSPDIAVVVKLTSVSGNNFAVSGDTLVGDRAVFERNAGGPDQWGQVAEVIGLTYAIDGDLIITGSPTYRWAKVRWYERNTGGADQWGLVTLFDGGTVRHTGIGRTVAVDGNTTVYGRGGGAFVSERDTDRTVSLINPDPGSGSGYFGYSVSISGDTAIVGSVMGESWGAAYVYRRNAGGLSAWGRVATLLPTTGVGAPTRFGFSVAIDGDTVVVGTYLSEGPEAAYVFERNEGGADQWGLVAKLTAIEPTVSSGFGGKVSISGDTIAVGAPLDDVSDVDTGSVHLFERNAGGPGAWGRVVKIVADDRDAGDEFGTWIALDGTVLAVGAPGDDDLGEDAGATYVYSLAGCAWHDVAHVEPPVDDTPTEFGRAVALSGSTAVVGAPESDAAGEGSGAAFVLARNAGSADGWGVVREMDLTDVAAGDAFGAAVSIDGDTLVVGTAEPVGYARVFERNVGGADVWGLVTTLAAPPGSPWFGGAVAIDGDKIVVGAFNGNGAAPFSGTAFVYERNRGGADGWGPVFVLNAADGAALDRFGGAVAIDDGTAVVGAVGDDGGGADAGAAYVFRRGTEADDWSQVAKLTADDAAPGDGFGVAVSIRDDTIVVGAGQDASGGPGAVYVFQRNTDGADQWGQVKKQVGLQASAGDRFGSTVSLGNDRFVVGAIGNGTGAAYVFERNAGGADAWEQVDRLGAAATDDGFGRAVALDGSRAVVGAHRDAAVIVFYHSCPTCGDGLREAPEPCDDGNTVDGDGCSADCSGEPCVDDDDDGFGFFGSVDCPGGPRPDCADDDAATFPGAPQSCEGVNNDCDDALWPALDGTNEFDDDGDGFTECAADCDDADATTWPGAPQICDGANNDCDDPDWPAVPAAEIDADADDVPLCADCDDMNPRTWPGAPQVCDGANNDCDDPNWPAIEATNEFDRDGDGLSTCAGDCGDLDADTYPGAPQLCDGRNTDCNHPGWPIPPAEERDDDHDGWSECEGDCDDTRAHTYPGALQRCDGVNNDCNDAAWPMPPTTEIDQDGDGFIACAECDDGDPAVFPGAAEICNGGDDDCDGSVDEGDTCALDDGIIDVWFSAADLLEWQLEVGFDTWNVYRGDLDALKTNREYTQNPEQVPQAFRDCARPDPFFVEPFVPVPNTSVFYLVTGTSAGLEGDLGVDSGGVPRPNDHACP